MRILTRQDIEINEQFFESLIVNANQARLDLGYQNSYPPFFGEADGISGLIIDKYGDYLSTQILSLGIDLRKSMFIDILKKVFNPKGIYERSDVAVRTKEGLDLFKDTIYGVVSDTIDIYENDC